MYLHLLDSHLASKCYWLKTQTAVTAADLAEQGEKYPGV